VGETFVVRRVVLFAAVAALSLSALGVAPSGATPNRPTGTISCTYLNGGHGSRLLVSKKAVALLVQSRESSCDNSGVTGGKAPITRVSASIKVKLPAGATCASLASPTPVSGRVQVKFSGANPQGHLMTVAAVNKPIATMSVSGDTFTFVSVPSTQNAFVGQTITLTATGVDSASGQSCTTGELPRRVYASGTVKSP
jgi:hypothetical protein